MVTSKTPPAFGSTIRDHYRKILTSGESLRAIQHRLDISGPPDLQGDADEMAAATLRATIEAKLKARDQMKPRNVAPMRRKA
jgi:hypothetical protein